MTSSNNSMRYQIWMTFVSIKIRIEEFYAILRSDDNLLLWVIRKRFSVFFLVSIVFAVFEVLSV